MTMMAFRILLLTTITYCTLFPLYGQAPQIQFEQFVHGTANLTGSYFYDVEEDHRGFIWIGGRPGLQRFDGTRFKLYNDKLSNVDVKALTLDSRGMLWISTRYGLNILDPATEEVTSFFHHADDSTSLSHNEVEPVLEAIDSGIFWVGSNDGLNKFNIDSRKVQRYYDRGESRSTDENKYYVIIQDVHDEASLWLGASHGLKKFNKSTGHFTRIPLPVNPTGLEQSVLGLYQDPTGYLYVGIAESNAVWRYDPMNKMWKAYAVESRKSLSPHRERGTYDFIPIAEHEVWVSMVPAIGTLNLESGQSSWIELDAQESGNALPSAVRHLFIDSRGHLWLPSLQGISRSVAPVITAQYDPSGVIITSVVIGEQVKHITPIESPNTIHLPYDQDRIGIEFSLINPSDRANVAYEYRLLGKSNAWSQIDTGYIVFDKIRAGLYQLELRGREVGKPWSQITATPLEMQSVWWQSPWLIALLLGGAGAIVLGFIITRRRHLRREQALTMTYERNLAEVQMEALRAQMNPHFLFNTMNSINHYILKNEAEAASTYLTKFSRLIRLVLQNSRSNTVKLADELEALRLYIEIEKLRFDTDYELFIGENVNLEKINVPPMMLQPYVENAIWHGLMHKTDDRKLSISVTRDDHYLNIIIKDNGIGRKAAKQYQQLNGRKKSYGMQITRDRIGLVNHLYAAKTDIEIIDVVNHRGEAAGTEIVISMPVVA